MARVCVRCGAGGAAVRCSFQEDAGFGAAGEVAVVGQDDVVSIYRWLDWQCDWWYNGRTCRFSYQDCDG